MLQIIFLILKIIGIVLLSVIGFVLLCFILVLFVPVRYQIKASWHGKAVAKAKMSWLLRIISISIEYVDDELKKTIRIFGIRYKRRERKNKASQRRQFNSKDNDRDIDKDIDICNDNDIDKDAISLKNDNIAVDKDMTSNDISITDVENIINFQDDEKKESNKTTSNKNKQEHTNQEEFSVFSKIKKFSRALFYGLRNIYYTIVAFYGKLIHIKDNIDYYVELLQDEKNQDAFKLCLKQLMEILSHIKPRRFRADLIIGTDDPASTGTILAVLGMIYPLFEGNLHVNPDFEKSVFDLELITKGRVIAFVMLRVAWKLYFNKDIKRLIATIRGGSMNGEQ